MVSRVALFLPLLLASALGESMWGPADTVQVLDVVISAVNKLVAAPGLTHDQAAHMKTVAAEIKQNIEEVEQNKNLTKAQAHAKVGAALQELSGLQSELIKEAKERKAVMDAADKVPRNDTAIREKIAQIKKELADKKADLAKDESMIKLYKLQKELIEKKLKLQKLLAARSSKGDVKKEQSEQGKMEGDMVNKVLNATKEIKAKSGSNDELPAPLKAVLADLKSRETKLAEELAKETAAETKYETALDKQLKEVPAKENTADLGKEKKMIKALKAEEKRKFRKAEASKKIELGEIKEAEAAIEKRDVVALTKVMSKMKTQSKALQAKSGDFLH